MKLSLFLLCLASLVSWSDELQLGAETSARPRWEALVINLKRRTDRLRHFSMALHEKESWIAADNHVCRIPGRDGHQLEPVAGADARLGQVTHQRANRATPWDSILKPKRRDDILKQVQQSYSSRPLDARKQRKTWDSIDRAARRARANLDGWRRPLKLIRKAVSMDSKANSKSGKDLKLVLDDIAATERESRHQQPVFPEDTKEAAAVPVQIPAGLLAVPTELSDRNRLVGSGWITNQTLFTAFSHMKKAQWPTMTYGGIGLYLGHAAAWQYVVDKQLDYGLIFEDDLTMFAPNFEKDVSDILKGKTKSDTDWDFLYLQRCDDMDWEKERSWWLPGRRASRRTAAKSVAVQIPAHETVTCTGAYIVTLSGAKKLLKGGFPATIQLDYALGTIPGLRRAALSPPVAQCQEVVKNMFGDKVRDTDVQTQLVQKGDHNDHHTVRAHNLYNDALAAEAMSTPSADFDAMPGEVAHLRGRHKQSLFEKHDLDIPDCTL